MVVRHNGTRSRDEESSRATIAGSRPSDLRIDLSVAGGAAGMVPRNNLNQKERRALVDELLKRSNERQIGQRFRGGVWLLG